MKIYELHSMTDSRLPFIFREMLIRSNHQSTLFENWHENVELLIITDGEGLIHLNELQIEVSRGDIVVANANCLHNIRTPSMIKYYYLIVDRSFCIANHFDTNTLHFNEHIKDEQLFSLCCGLADEFDEINDEKFSVQMIRAKILLILGLLCRKYSRPDTLTHADTHLLSCIKRAIGFIHSESDRDISLEDTADFSGLSKYYFAHEFKRITGYSFVSYLNLIRCKKAKRMLCETQKSIREISAECGFSDQSYFTKVFKKYYGMLPVELRQKNHAPTFEKN